MILSPDAGKSLRSDDYCGRAFRRRRSRLGLRLNPGCEGKKRVEEGQTMEGSVYSGGSPLSWKNIEEYSAQFPGESPADVASRLLQELTDEAIRAFATLHITHVITHFRREQSRNVERSNELVTTAPSSSAPSEMGRKGALLTAEEWHSQSPEERQAREKAAYLSVAEWYRKPAKERRAIEEAERAERRALREQEHQEWL